MIKKDEIVSCPNCGEEIAKVTRDLYEGDPVHGDMFEGFKRTIRDGDAPTCDKCKARWYDLGRLHIKGIGWAP